MRSKKTNNIANSVCLTAFIVQFAACQASGEFPNPEQQAILDIREQRIKEGWTVYEQQAKRHHALMVTLLEGNMNGLDALVAAKDTDALWFLWREAGNWAFPIDELKSKVKGGAYEFGGVKYSARLLIRGSAEHDALHEQLKTEIRPRLASIPGHAVARGDRVDKISNEKGWFGIRSGLLKELGELGSMEAIQQLGRFLYDKRNPEGGFWPVEAEMDSPKPNDGVAAEGIHRALGAASPFKPMWAMGPPKVEEVQRWWESEASRPYREWNAEEYEPMPPPRRKVKAIAAVQSGASTAAGSRESGNGAASPQAAWLALAACAAGILVATLFAARKRR